jgi:hypothetical protein
MHVLSIFGETAVTLTAQDVAEITRLLEESDFDELHLEHEGFKLTLRRGAGGARPGAARVSDSGAAAGRGRGCARRVSAAHARPMRRCSR